MQNMYNMNSLAIQARSPWDIERFLEPRMKLYLKDFHETIDRENDTIQNLWYGLTDLPMVWFSRNDGTPEWWVSIVDGYMDFDGVDGTRVSLANTTLYQNSFTVCWWATKESLSSSNILSQNWWSNDNRFILWHQSDWATPTLRTNLFIGGTQMTGRSHAIPINGDVFFFFYSYDSSDNSTVLYIDDNEATWTLTTWVSSNTAVHFIWARHNGNNVRDGKINIMMYNRKLSNQDRISIMNAWKDAYSPITDWLVAQYSGRDFAGTEANPTTIYDTNWIGQISATDTRTILAFRGGQYLNYGWVMFTPSDSYSVLANYRLKNISTWQLALARMTGSNINVRQPSLIARSTPWNWVRRSLHNWTTEFNADSSPSTLWRQQISGYYNQPTWDFGIYKDATLEDSNTFTGTMQSGSTNTIIGAQTPSTSDVNLIADMESLAVADFALTPTLVKSWYDKVKV